MKYFLSFGLSLWTMSAFCQGTTVSGSVRDEDNQPIQGVNVFVVDSYDGTTTDEDGSFSFTTDQPGAQALAVHLIGYQNDTVAVDLAQSDLTLAVVLKEEALQLSGATVTASRDFEASDRNKVSVLTPLDILTTGGANADITYALQTLPGTQPTSNQTGLFVRGGTGDETRVYIDGLAVNNFYYQGTPGIAQRGRFSPNLFQGSFFNSGGYSALYGQALSSTLILESRDLPDHSSVDLSLSSVGGQAGVDLLSKDQKSSVGSTIKYTNLSPYYRFVKQDRTFAKMPEYVDGTLNFRRKIGGKGILKFYGSYGSSAVALLDHELEDPRVDYRQSIDNRNVYTNLTYRGYLGKNTRLDVGTSFSTNHDVYHSQAVEEGPSAKRQRSHDADVYQARSVLTHYYRNLEVKVGGELAYNVDTWTSGRTTTQAADYLTSVFTEGQFTLLDKFRAQVGMRVENSSLLDKYNVAPRASLAYLTGKQSQVSFAYGQFYQKPPSFYGQQSPSLGYEKSEHYILSYQKMKANRTFRTELFYKTYDNLIKTVPDTSNAGYGYAKGAEVFWRDKSSVRNLDYWVSYSFLDTKRDFLDYSHLAQPNFAARHTASVVAKRFIPAWSTSLGLTYTFGSGRPYYNPNRPPEGFMVDRTASYHNLNAQIAYLAKIRGANAIFVLSANNVLGNTQIFDYRYSATDPSVRQASAPLARRFFYAGVFLNWGVDKRQQTLDELL